MRAESSVEALPEPLVKLHPRCRLDAPFPLTPALSPEEREHRWPLLDRFNGFKAGTCSGNSHPGALPFEGRGRIGGPVHGFNARNLVSRNSLPGRQKKSTGIKFLPALPIIRIGLN